MKTKVGGLHSQGVAGCAVRLSMCESTDGWLVAWGMCGRLLVLSSTLWLLFPFTLL